MDKEDEERLGMMILEFMRGQKMIGKTSIKESEICEALGIEWDSSLEDKNFELTDLGEDAIDIYKSQSNRKFL